MKIYLDPLDDLSGDYVRKLDYKAGIVSLGTYALDISQTAIPAPPGGAVLSNLMDTVTVNVEVCRGRIRQRCENANITFFHDSMTHDFDATPGPLDADVDFSILMFATASNDEQNLLAKQVEVTDGYSDIIFLKRKTKIPGDGAISDPLEGRANKHYVVTDETDPIIIQKLLKTKVREITSCGAERVMKFQAGVMAKNQYNEIEVSHRHHDHGGHHRIEGNHGRTQQFFGAQPRPFAIEYSPERQVYRNPSYQGR